MRRPVFALPAPAVLVAAALVCLCPFLSSGSDFFTVEPTSISAGSFYSGADLQIEGVINEHSQVAIRLTGPLEHQTFNRRGKIGGLIWGGIEHVTFVNAPTLYAVFTSAALAATAHPAERKRLQLGYDSLATHITMEKTRTNAQELIRQFMLLKEREHLYCVAPGAVHLDDSENGERKFRVSVRLPATTPPGSIKVAVFELAGGSVARQEVRTVKLLRVGMPAYLFHLAHERATVFGFAAVILLLLTGLVVDVLGSWKTVKKRHPAIIALRNFTYSMGDVFLSIRRHPWSSEDVERLQAKYRLFRNILNLNNELLEALAEVEEESSWTSFRHPRIRMGIRALFDGTADMVRVLNELADNRYFDLGNVIAGIRADISDFLAKVPEEEDPRLTLHLDEINSKTAGHVGGKALNLARVECDLKLRVAPSFVVTIEAYREFLEVGGLASELRTILAPGRLDAAEDFRRRCEMAKELVQEAAVPAAVTEALHNAYSAWNLPEGEGVAVRSSASGEDSELSFAGQFETVLNVPESGLVDAWKRVVVSRFSPSAVFYRRVAGLAEVDTPMAVLVQQMVHARASGVLFTRRPDDPRASVILITAVRGLGQDASIGIASADEFTVSRTAPHQVIDRRIARKAALLVGANGGGLARLPLEVREQLQASVTDEEIGRLAELGLNIERYFGRAQDIEWAIDEDGRLFVVQARPLRAEKADEERLDIPRDAPLLLHGGNPAWPGRAVGPVHVAHTPQEEDETPAGALLVVPQLLPDCVRFLPRVCGVVTERGTVTGHAASIAREFRVPSLFGLPGAVDSLVPGQMVSLDAPGRSIYAGALWPELRGRLPIALLGHRSMGLPKVLATKLTTLSGSSFMASWTCQSLHDVIRFAHEMAIQAMFDTGDLLLDSRIGGVKRLDCLPQVYMHIIDLGGGLCAQAASKRTIKPEDVVSFPFNALWRGLGDERFDQEHSKVVPRSFGSIVASSMTTGSSRALGSPNFACITDSYLNLNSRQAYHYAIVDSFLSDNQNNNHISIRVKGGAAASAQRELRAYFVGEVLRPHHFNVNVTGDLVNAWARGIDRVTGADKLAMIGYLLRYLSRLDMWMTSETDVKLHEETFAELMATLPENGAPKESD